MNLAAYLKGLVLLLFSPLRTNTYYSRGKTRSCEDWIESLMFRHIVFGVFSDYKI